MPRDIKIAFLEDLRKRYPSAKKPQGSQSLYEIGNGVARIYIRYSKVHSRNQAFFGLRKEDLKKLEGHPSILCFLWDGQSHPLLIPFSEYEEIFKR